MTEGKRKREEERKGTERELRGDFPDRRGNRERGKGAKSAKRAKTERNGLKGPDLCEPNGLFVVRVRD